jgi:predicted phosphoribosyltransferase
VGTPRIYPDRETAGKELAAALRARALQGPVAVLGLPRGGVPVAYPVACVLGAPLDVLIVRKIGMPGQPEYAVGALAMGDVLVWDPRFAHGDPDAAHTVHDERMELARRERAYRRGRPPLDLKGRTVVLVDDGLATGLTMVAAVRSVFKAGAVRVLAAAPVASKEAVALVEGEGAEAAVLQTPPGLSSIGEWYGQFEQLDDEQVLRLLKKSRARPVQPV